MSSQQRFIMNVNRLIPQSVSTQNNYGKPPITKEKVMSYEEKSVGSTPFYKCEACPYMALAEDDIKFHLFTVHPDLAKTNGLADNIQIPCPGCTSIFDAELTLRTHLRNHHKMGIKDVKKMVKSLVQIALKNAKLKKEEKREDPSPPAPIRQAVADVKMPQVIEIVPDIVHANNSSLPQGVTFISIDELQKMSTPNFEAVDPKEIIQEASINIVYTNPVSQYLNVSDSSISNSTCSLIQMPSTTPDLISSIQPRVSSIIDNNHLPLQQPIEHDPISHPIPILPKPGRTKCSISLQTYDTDGDSAENDIDQKLGKLCASDDCRIRLKDEEKLSYHRKCHQDGTLQCPECNKVLATVESLHTHLWKVHAIDMELHTCEVCGYKTFRKRLLNIHIKCHENVRSYTCAICSKSFKNANQLSKHRVAHKKDTGIIKCSICQRVCATVHKLKAHIAEVHDKLKEYKCPNCEYTASRPGQLKVHLRSHTGDKPYNCNKCKYRSGDHNAMRRHKRTHSKESLYQCKYCPYSAIQSTCFASHMINKHPNVTSSDVHRCPYCTFKSVSKEKYVMHLTTHPDKEGVKLLIEMTKEAKRTETKPSWTIPSENAEDNSSENTSTSVENKETSPSKTVNKFSMELYNCDSQQESLPQNYAKNYSTHTSSEAKKNDFHDQVIVTDFSKDDNNSDCLISESSNDTLIDRQYPPLLQSNAYENTQTSLHSLITSVSMEQNILQSSNASSSVSNLSPIDTSMKNIMSNFPIRLPPAPSTSVRNNITLKPVDKIFSMTKVTGPIIRPTQILPVPSSSNSPVNFTTTEPESGPRKKPKISVKSNLILKGPDQVNMFHSQQKMAFKRLEDNERFGLGRPVTFNNLISTQFMQLPPESTLGESPNNILAYPQETLLDESATPPVDNALSDNSQIFNFNQQINVSSMSMLPPQPKIQTTDPSYIKLESTIKQNTQSPSLERMCTANTILHTQPISREYKASPPLEDIHKNMGEIKNEVKSDYYNIPLSNTTSNPPMMDQYLIDNLMGEQYPGHIDISSIVLPPISEEEDQQNDVIEIDDNSDDNKLLPRFDMNFPLESMYLMHNDFHFLENDMPSSEAPVNEMNRMITEVPILSQKEGTSDTSDGPTGDFPNFIQGRKDPMMNTSVRPSTNKINVKNIELMKN